MTTKQKNKDFDRIIEDLEELNPKAMLAEGFDGALVGYVRHFGQYLACYDMEQCIQILIKNSDMDHQEAVEFFEFNVVGSWVGAETPVFLTTAKNIP